MIIKRGHNENDNAITKNKLTKRNTKKSLIVEYTHETKKEFKINMLIIPLLMKEKYQKNNIKM